VNVIRQMRRSPAYGQAGEARTAEAEEELTDNDVGCPRRWQSEADGAPTENNDPVENAMKREFGEQLAKAVSELEPSLRAAFTACALEGQTLEEYRQRACLTRGCGRGQFARAKEILRDKLKNHSPYE
jgi:DNA-directed RNA polymerase specialized sigma24 family protein